MNAVDLFPTDDDQVREIANTETGEIIEHSGALVTIEASPTINFIEQREVPDLDAMEAGTNISTTYWEAKNEGEILRAVLIGWSSMKSKKGDDLPLAVFQNKAGIWTNAGANLVQQLRTVPLRTPLQVTYQGTEKTNSGNNVKKFKVQLLNVPMPQAAPAPEPVAHNLGKGVQVKSKQAQPA